MLIRWVLKRSTWSGWYRGSRRAGRSSCRRRDRRGRSRPPAGMISPVDGGSAGRAAAAQALASRAAHAYERRQAAVAHQAELAEALEHPVERAREAGRRAEDAARAAGAAQARA